MALGNVSVGTKDSGAGSFKTPERQLLYVGAAGKGWGKILYIDQSTDLDEVLGDNASRMKTAIYYARLNAAANWTCIAVPRQAIGEWQDAYDMAMSANVVCEGVVVTDPIKTKDDINDMNTNVVNAENEHGRMIFFAGATEKMDATTQTWSDFIAEFETLQDTVYATGVVLVPEITSGWLGCLMGRLCNELVSIADSPMRVATGGIVGITTLPSDMGSVQFNNSHAKALNDARGTVPQTYVDYAGIYCSDCMTLAPEASDFGVLENVRVVNKAKRQVRILAIKKIANRELNNTAASMDSHVAYFAAPLTTMSRSMRVNGIYIPGDCKPPKDGDIGIEWLSKTNVQIALTVTPHNSPKSIAAYVGLNLANEA
ncbi:DUF2586 domain-containing protein [Marinomonas sp. RSW2]|uniref:DUF2586 domain-containing protein n=1 Tax=Marinomonas maritima TaxID=2940935 RepID=A0ABT5WIM4_9GAMM|nr:DUF2586 domain-containing protein [Marinomonas maritima]MDE8603900.1 DUF2586 domain-containing protein [Marinomonas maritima]